MQVDLLVSNTPISYPEAVEKMESMVAEIISGLRPATIWLLEHEDVYTYGTNSNPADLLEAKFPLYQTGRGGKHTYHGPGQRIIYFIRDVLDSVREVFSELGVKSHIDDKDVGLWNENNEKLVALGIRVRRWVTYHGIAVNIAPDLSKYLGIIPCGIKDKKVTSLKNMGVKVSMQDFDKLLLERLARKFNLHFV
jgi:lipoyl(octanoyl) transferase